MGWWTGKGYPSTRVITSPDTFSPAPLDLSRIMILAQQEGGDDFPFPPYNLLIPESYFDFSFAPMRKW